jgi:hypothetical protein
VPVLWAWSNMHGGALGGLATLGLALFGWCVFGLLRLSSPIATWRQAALLCFLMGACASTVLFNPYGWRLPLTWLEIMRSPVVARLIEEHAPLDPRSPSAWLVLLLGLIYVGAIASLRPWRPRFAWLIPLFWLVQALLRVRHSPLFAITATLALAEMLPYTHLAVWLALPGRDLFRFQGNEPEPLLTLDWRAALFPLLLVALATSLQAVGVQAPILGRGWVRLDPHHWPVDLLPELREIERVHPEGSRIFNDFLYGGFLIYYTPGLKVFIDDRCEIYGDERLAAYFEATTRDMGRIDEWARQYEIPHALVASGSKVDRYLERSGVWTVVKRCGAATLYRRRIEA